MGQVSSVPTPTENPARSDDEVSSTESEYEYESEDDETSNDDDSSSASSSNVFESEDDALAPLKNDHHILLNEDTSYQAKDSNKPSVSCDVGVNGHEDEHDNVEAASIDLTMLSEEELKQHITEFNLSREDVLSTSKMLENVNCELYASYRDNVNDFLLDYPKDDKNEKTRMEVAVLLNNISPTLSTLRFKMVPARLSEHKFWSAVFCLLQESRPDSLPSIAPTTLNNDNISNLAQSIEKDEVDISTDEPVKTIEDKGDRVHGKEETVSFEVFQLQEKLKLAEKELQQLKCEIKTLKNSTKTSNDGENPAGIHKGTWIMDKESEEFFTLDEEVKKQLREQKKKRLREVLDQMKFILDCDDVSGTNGRWDCCGKTEYYTDVCALAN